MKNMAHLKDGCDSNVLKLMEGFAALMVKMDTLVATNITLGKELRDYRNEVSIFIVSLSFYMRRSYIGSRSVAVTQH